MDLRQKIKVWLVVALGIVGGKTTQAQENDPIRKNTIENVVSHPENNDDKTVKLSLEHEMQSDTAVKTESFITFDMKNPQETLQKLEKIWYDITYSRGATSKLTKEDKTYLLAIASLGQEIGRFRSMFEGQTFTAEDLQAIKSDSLAKTIAAKAVQRYGSKSPGGYCYRGVKYIVCNSGAAVLDGGDAYMATDYLRQNPNFVHCNTAYKDMPELPEGVVFIKDKNLEKNEYGITNSPSGHIGIALGDGTEVSDGRQRVRDNNVRSSRNRTYYSEENPDVFISQESTMSGYRLLDWFYGKTKEAYPEKLYISPKNLFDTAMEIVKKSEAVTAEKMEMAKLMGYTGLIAGSNGYVTYTQTYVPRNTYRKPTAKKAPVKRTLAYRGKSRGR